MFLQNTGEVYEMLKTLALHYLSNICSVSDCITFFDYFQTVWKNLRCFFSTSLKVLLGYVKGLYKYNLCFSNFIVVNDAVGAFI